MGVSMETAAGRLQRQGGPGSTQPELTSCAVTPDPLSSSDEAQSRGNHNLGIVSANSPPLPQGLPELSARAQRQQSRGDAGRAPGPLPRVLTVTAQEVKVAAGRESPSPLPTKDTML